MGKNKALAHHTSTYFHTRRVSIQLSRFRSPTLAGAPFGSHCRYSVSCPYQWSSLQPGIHTFTGIKYLVPTSANAHLLRNTLCYWHSFRAHVHIHYRTATKRRSSPHFQGSTSGVSAQQHKWDYAAPVLSAPFALLYFGHHFSPSPQAAVGTRCCNHRFPSSIFPSEEAPMGY